MNKRLLEALAALQSKLVDVHIIVQRVVPMLVELSLEPSELATKRYHEILSTLTNR